MSASSPWRRAAADGRDERALGALGVAHLDEAAEPAPRAASRPVAPPGSGSSGKRGAPARRVARPRRRGRGRAPPPVVRRRAAGTRFMRQVSVVRPAEPAAAAARDAEVEPGAERRRRRSGRPRASAIADFASTSGMSRSSPSCSRSRWCATGSSRAADGRRARRRRRPHREAAQVVGELVERAAGGEVEARVVPVAGEDPVADACRGGAGSPCAGSGCRRRSTRRRRRTGRACGRRRGRRVGRPREARRATRRGRGVLQRRSSVVHRVSPDVRTSSNV